MATRSSGSDSEGEATLINLDSGNFEKEQDRDPVNGQDRHHAGLNGSELGSKEVGELDSESDSLDELETKTKPTQVKFSGLSPEPEELGQPSEQEVAATPIEANMAHEKLFGVGAGIGLDDLMGDYETSLNADEEVQMLESLQLGNNTGPAGDYDLNQEAVAEAYPAPPRTAPAPSTGWVPDEDSGIGKDLELLVHNVRKAGLIAPDVRITPKELRMAEKKSPKPEIPAQSQAKGLASSLPRPSTTRPGTLSLGSAQQKLSLSSSNSPSKKFPATARTRSRPSASPVADLSPLGPTKGAVSSPDFTSRLYRPTASASAKYSINNLATTPTGSKAKISKSNSTPSPAKASPKPKMGDAGGVAAGSGEGGVNIKDQFTAFSKFGDATSDGKQITLSNADKWMKQAKVIDGKKITTTDTSIAFKKLFKTAKKVSFDEFKTYVEDLSKSKKLEPEEILKKLTNCGAPGLSQATKAAHASVVERLTDTSKYTGSHKERFDASGKGRGIEGRREVKDESGYTAAFKGKLEESKKEEIVPPASN